jgi:two-component system, chemotaxis family, response regulator Rcp1
MASWQELLDRPEGTFTSFKSTPTMSRLPETSAGISESERTILIVEDNSFDVALLRHTLDHHGVRSRIVVMKDDERASKFLDGAEAKEQAVPALIILDLNLPTKTGRELLARVRQSLLLRDVPVVVFSSSEAETDRQEALRLGANRYVTKPSNLDAFLNIVRF